MLSGTRASRNRLPSNDLHLEYNYVRTRIGLPWENVAYAFIDLRTAMGAPSGIEPPCWVMVRSSIFPSILKTRG